MAVFTKMLRWIWCALLCAGLSGSLIDHMYVAAALLLLAIVATLPIKRFGAVLANHGITPKMRLAAGIIFSLLSFVAIGATAPPAKPLTEAERAEQAKRDAADRAEAAAVKAEADRQGSAEKAAAGAKARAEREVAAAAERKAQEERASGLHCLSEWDGSNQSMVAQVKGMLRDPDSFKHYETRIGKLDAKGQHRLMMEYGARNGFGGMNRQLAVGLVDGESCAATVVSLGE